MNLFSLTQNRGNDFAYINQSPRNSTPVTYDDNISVCSINSRGRGENEQGLSEPIVGKEASFSVCYDHSDVAKNGVHVHVLQPVQSALFFTSKDEDDKQIKSKKRRKCTCSNTDMNYHVDDNNNAAGIEDSPPRMLLMTPSTTSITNIVGGTSDLHPRPTRLEILKKRNIMSTTLKTSTRRDLYSIFESIDKMLILTRSQNKQELVHGDYSKSTSTRRAGLPGETKEDTSSTSSTSNHSF